MKKKICIITSSFPSHKNEAIGAGVFVRDFALLLAEQNFDVHVLAPITKSLTYDDDRIHVHFFHSLAGEMGRWHGLLLQIVESFGRSAAFQSSIFQHAEQPQDGQLKKL